MLTSLLLRNFQSHRKTELNFHPNINAIIGTSNSGKTALLRGLYWVVYNRPSGLSFISHWNRDKKGNPIKETSARIIQNDIEVIRIRSEELNGYVIKDSQGELKLEAIGMDVPEMISNTLNLGEVNIQKQMDSPFLLSETSGEVARFFNKEIKLDLIDKILSCAESKRRQFNNDIKITSASIVSTEKELIQYEILDSAKVLCDKLGITEKDILEMQTKIDVMDNLFAEYNEQLKNIKNYSKIDFKEIERIFIELDGIKTNEENQKASISLADSLLGERFNLIMEINKTKIEVKQYENELPNVCPLCGNKLEGTK